MTRGIGLAYVMVSTVADHLVAYCEPFPGLYLYYPSRAHLAPKLRARRCATVPEATPGDRPLDVDTPATIRGSGAFV